MSKVVPDRFDPGASSPTFSFEGFLLRNDEIASPGFDEWNEFAVPDSCLRNSQFSGRYLPAQRRLATAHVGSEPVPMKCRPVTAGIGTSKKSLTTFELVAPDAIGPPRLQRPNTALVQNRSRPTTYKKSISVSVDRAISPILEYFQDTKALLCLDSSSDAAGPKRSALKGKMFSTLKAADLQPNDSLFKTYENEYDLRMFSRHSLNSENDDECSDSIPEFNKPLQVHSRIMGWKLMSPSRRALLNRPRRVKCVTTMEPITLKTMGYTDSVNEGLESISGKEQRIRNRQIDALHNIFRYS